MKSWRKLKSWRDAWRRQTYIFISRVLGIVLYFVAENVVVVMAREENERSASGMSI